MLKRVLVAVVGVPLLILVLSFAPDWATMLLTAALCAVGAHELMQAVAGEKGRRFTPVTVAVAAAVPVNLWWYQPAAPSAEKILHAMQHPAHGMPGLFSGGESSARPSLLPLIALLFIFVLFFYLILHYGKDTAIPFSDLTAALFAGLGFPLMLSCLLRLRMMPYGEFLVWMPLAVSFGSDTFALFFGMAFGKHKMAPLVSPHKTVEGGFGGLVGGVLGLGLLKLIAWLTMGVTLMTWWQLLVLGILGGAVDEIGDLSFSVIKREFGVKDYGKLLPGHGGVLDRFDSVTFVAPLVWFIFKLIAG
jgi:phosphatidate cytidylyltransferase